MTFFIFRGEKKNVRINLIGIADKSSIFYRVGVSLGDQLK